MAENTNKKLIVAGVAVVATSALVYYLYKNKAQVEQV